MIVLQWEIIAEETRGDTFRNRSSLRSPFLSFGRLFPLTYSVLLIHKRTRLAPLLLTKEKKEKRKSGFNLAHIALPICATDCYGVPLVPKHDWYCKRCEPHSHIRASKVVSLTLAILAPLALLAPLNL